MAYYLNPVPRRKSSCDEGTPLPASSDEAVLKPTSSSSPGPPFGSSRESRRFLCHGRAPIIMCASFILGIALSIGHHAFYSSYDGTLVQGSMGQQWVNRVGTAFAFLFKTSLSVAAGSAYVQRQWYKLGSRSYSVAQVDSLFGILSDATLFLDKFWVTDGLLGLLALSTWLLPLAAVVTPGSLTVRASEQADIRDIKPAQLQWNVASYAITDLYNADGGYTSPTTEVSRIAVAAATSGQVLQISTGYQNVSYTLEFLGPAVKCAMNNTLSEDVYKAWCRLYNLGIPEWPTSFVSWVPSDTVHGAPWYDFSSTQNLEVPYDTVDTTSVPSGGLPPGVPLPPPIRLMVATPHNSTSYRLDVHECILYNASYRVNFDFQYPKQTVQVQRLEFAEAIVGNDSADVSASPGSYYTPEYSERRLSYKAIMDAFGSILVGTAISLHYTGPTQEVGGTNYTGLAQAIGGTRYAQTKVDWNQADNTRRTLEELFQNITLSMFSSDSQLLKSPTDADSVSAIVTTYPNKYVYEPFDLWLAYGVAIGVTLVCLTFGYDAIVRNHEATYSNRFSTILRTTRSEQFDDLVDEGDDGSDPIPARIASARLLHEGRRT